MPSVLTISRDPTEGVRARSSSARGESPGHDEHAEEEDGPFFLWRVKAGYSIHLGHRVSAMPSISLDLVREHGEWVEAWVAGVSVGLHF